MFSHLECLEGCELLNPISASLWNREPRLEILDLMDCTTGGVRRGYEHMKMR